MTSKENQQSMLALNAGSTTDLAKHGITRTQVDYFYLGKYRYTDLKDAIAQAQRQNSTS